MKQSRLVILSVVIILMIGLALTLIAVGIALAVSSQSRSEQAAIGVSETGAFSSATQVAGQRDTVVTQQASPTVTMAMAASQTPTSQPVVPTPAPATSSAIATIAPSPTLSPGPQARDDVSAFALIINQMRCSQGLAPLSVDGRLSEAARLHNLDMIANIFFSHTGSNGSDIAERVTLQAYPWIVLGENLAGGTTSPQETFDGWWNSPGHKANMVNPDFREMGLSHIYDENSEWGHYWTLVLGATGDERTDCAALGL